MTPQRHHRLMELFDHACELPRREALAFVEALSADDADLRGPLAGMLEVDHRSQVFFDHTKSGAASLLARDILESALSGQGATPQPPGALPRCIGEYDILERVGIGGMGTVYRARQHQPERVVALKALHPWLVSPSTLAHFRFEAQALATLKHPSIPPIFAVGQHENTVYFAMELVTGPNLIEWARARQPDTRTRVARLIDICDAVHHAHLRGFVHRDLKPDNIRVGDDGVPRVLDFGISAGLGERSAEVSGTPAYMSPEQVEPGAVVDVRSDVYSLGIIAFEVLAGRLPVVPPRSGLATLQALKRAPVPRLTSVAAGLGGDLDAIVARALAVDPEQRYASAAELASELRRHLDHEPVEARRGGPLYRFGRLVRRHRVAFTALTAVLMALLTGAVVSALQYWRAQAARVVAEQARDRAASEAERAKATLEFLRTVLAQADPEQGHGRSRQVPIGDALDRAAEQLASKHLDPPVVSAVHASLAETYMGLGEYKPADREANLAVAVYDAAHLEDDELLAKTLLLAAQVRHENGLGEAALEAGARAIAVERHVHGTVEPHTHVGYALHVQAVGLREAGKLAEAEALHREGLAVERALAQKTGITEDLADALNQYAVTLVVLGRYEDAEPKYREALAMDLAQFGPRHHEVATDYHHLAWLANEQDRPAEAMRWLDQALEIRLATIGPDHVRVGIQRNLEALVQLALGNVAAADAALDDCLRIAAASYGTEHARYTRMEQSRVLVRVTQGRVDEALALGERIWKFHASRYGPTHWVTLGSRSDLAVAQLAAGQRDQAVAGLTEVVDLLRQSLGERSKATRDARKRLAEALAR